MKREIRRPEVGRVKRATASAAALLLVGTSLATAPLAGQAESFRLDGRRLAVYNLAGRVEIVEGSGPDVVVEVTRRGDDGAALEVAVSEIRGRQALRIVYPDDRIVYGAVEGSFNSSTRVGDDGTFGDGGSRGRRVDIRSRGSGFEGWADLRIEVPPGRDLAVYVAVGAAEVEGVDGDLLIDTGTGSIDARNVRGFLRVDTGSGSVSVRDVDGELEIDTGSGSVTVDNVTGPRVYVDTGSGGVRGTDVTTRSLEVDTGSGGIEMFRVSAPDVLLDTGSGSVEVEITSDVESLDVDTGSGSVTVRLPEGVGGEIEVDTGSGRIDIDFPIELRVMRRDHVEGRIGDGRGVIRIDTGSGSVRVSRGSGPEVR